MQPVEGEYMDSGVGAIPDRENDYERMTSARRISENEWEMRTGDSSPSPPGCSRIHAIPGSLNTMLGPGRTLAPGLVCPGVVLRVAPQRALFPASVDAAVSKRADSSTNAEDETNTKNRLTGARSHT